MRGDPAFREVTEKDGVMLCYVHHMNRGANGNQKGDRMTNHNRALEQTVECLDCGWETWASLVEMAYEYADAMLRASEKQP